MNLAGRLLRLMGWKVSVTAPDYPKCIICVAPHTSNLDFILGKLAYAAVGRHAGFLMKETWFFWPLGCLFKAIGGIPVPRRKKRSSLTRAVIDRFNSSSRLQLAITPEGTRSRTSRWHTGFLHIAAEANVPIELGVIDFKTKTISIDHVLETTGDIDTDLRRVKQFYKPFTGRYPNKFTAEDE